MGVMSAEWVLSLTADSAEAPDPACFPATIAAATARIGSAPVRWAVETAMEQAGLNIAQLAPLTSSPHDLELVRLAVEPAVIAVLVNLHAGVVEPTPVPDEIRFVLREYVRRQVPLDATWASILRGHGRLAEALNAACRRLVSPADQAGQLQLLSRLLFEYVERLSVGAGEVYAEEQRLWSQSASRSRDQALRAVLAGERTDTDAIAMELRYRIDHRTHLGLVLRRTTVGPGGPDLADTASALLERNGATSHLVVPFGALEVWAWGSRGDQQLDHLETTTPAGTSTVLQIASGNPGRGLVGFRRTHRQAQSAGRASQLLGDGHQGVTTFAEVALISLLTTNLREAREFVHEELGGLSVAHASTADLRETVLTYLECNRSPQTAAQRLFVSRNTVTYRVNRAEALLGHPLADRETEVRAALRLSRVVGILGSEGDGVV